MMSAFSATSGRDGSDVDDVLGTLDVVSEALWLARLRSLAEETELANEAAAVDTITTAVETAEATLLAVADRDASAISIARSAPSPLKSGMRRVHQNAMRRLRSTMRCLRMKNTTRMKKARLARMSRWSSQSDFSSAVVRCFEVVMSEESTSCVEDADLSEAVDDSGWDCSFRDVGRGGDLT